ncbi:MAG: hypothetical protein AAGI03_06240 [Pseudomonadota bacterium]
MTEQILFQSGRYRVTARSLYAPRRTFILARVEATRIRRPFLVMALALMGACYGFAFTFEHLLYGQEIAALLLAPPILAILMSQIGVLSIRYFGGAGEGGTVIGRASSLADVRGAIDQVLEDQPEGFAYSSIGQAD